MEKFLFTDGSSRVKEANSRRELEDWVSTCADKSLIRVWMYGHNEWIPYASFSARFPITRKLVREQLTPIDASVPVPKSKGRWKRRLPAYAFIAVCIFLVFNFTKLRWEKPEQVILTASRPANVPVMDVDSLIADIEYTRREKIDRNTKSNLRLRNTWPDVIQLEISATKKVSDRKNKYSDISLKLDNTTGHTINEAVVMLNSWNGGKISNIDTFHFSNIGYNRAVHRDTKHEVKADSISVAFQSILAKTFNFCYSISKDNPSGNYNDRWFCRNN